MGKISLSTNMKKIVIMILAGLMAFAPGQAQSRKVVKQAKEDAKLLVKQFKSDGYKSLDNAKLDDAVTEYLTLKYSDKSVFEVIGKATDKDLNQAKADARSDALSFYPAANVANSFFLYKKNRRKYDVVCYALVGGSTRYQTSRESTSSSVAFARAEQEKKEAKAEAKKAEKEAKKEIQKARKKAEKEAEKVRKKADKEHQKAIEKANEKAQKAIEKADKKREEALKGIR